MRGGRLRRCICNSVACRYAAPPTLFKSLTKKLKKKLRIADPTTSEKPKRTRKKRKEKKKDGTFFENQKKQHLSSRNRHKTIKILRKEI